MIRIKKEKLIYTEDCKRIQNALMNKEIYATLEQCDELWRMYSEDNWCAGWVSMEGTSDQEIYSNLRQYFEEWPEGSVDTRYI